VIDRVVLDVRGTSESSELTSSFNSNEDSIVNHWRLAALLIVSHVCLSQARADESVFSGPQVGEALPPLTVRSVLGETAGQDLDLVEKAAGRPVLLIFVHERTRPAFGLTNLLTRYVAKRAGDGLHGGVVFLTEDATATEQWTRVVQRHFSPDAVTYGISHDGQEGPGAYGLNRNVALTVLVGKEGKVTANFALVQPSDQADGPKILKAIVDAMGGGEVPTLAELGANRYQDRMPARMTVAGPNADARLSALLRELINPRATEEEVKAAARKIETYVAENEDARKELGQIAVRIVESKRLDTYGTKPAQEALQKWAKEHGKRQAESDGKAEEKSAN
jgi:hypothetical protein